MIKHNMFKRGVLIRNKKGLFIIDDMEDSYVFIRDVYYDKQGVRYCGKRKVIGIKDLDNYRVV